MIDGLGIDAVVADVVIVGDRIVFVGDAIFSEEELVERVTRRIDASGQAVDARVYRSAFARRPARDAGNGKFSRDGCNHNYFGPGRFESGGRTIVGLDE